MTRVFSVHGSGRTYLAGYVIAHRSYDYCANECGKCGGVAVEAPLAKMTDGNGIMRKVYLRTKKGISFSEIIVLKTNSKMVGELR